MRGQYSSGVIDGEEVPGYRQEEGVASDSQIETFVALKLFVDNWRWQGVPFYMRAGKRLERKVSKIAPDVPGVFIKEAFSYLETSDVAIGPATDGGYYLVGFRYDTFLPEVFEGIQWSTDTVFRETMNILEKFNQKVHILPEWSDVDTIDDIRNLIPRNQDTEFKFSKTISYISGKKEVFN